MWKFILEESFDRAIPYRMDKRIREWQFLVAFDGAYDGDLFMGICLCIFVVDHVHRLSWR